MIGASLLGARGGLLLGPFVPGTGQWIPVPNGGFETGDVPPWGMVGSSGQFTATTTEAAVGRYSAKGQAYWNFDGPGFAAINQAHVTEGVTYVLSGFVKAPTAGPLINFYLDLDDIPGEPNIGPDYGVNGWQFIWGEFAAMGNGTVNVRLVVDGLVTTNDVVYFDEVALTPKDQFQPPQPVTLSIVASANAVTLSWPPCGLFLQSAPDVTGPWTTLAPAVTNGQYSLSPGAQRAFFRLASIPPSLAAITWSDPALFSYATPPQWFSVFLQLPAGYDPAAVDLSSVRICGWLEPEPGFAIGDRNGDGIPELELRVAGFSFIRSMMPWPVGGSGDLVPLAYSIWGHVMTPGPFDFIGNSNLLAQVTPVLTFPWFCACTTEVRNPGFEQVCTNSRPCCWWYDYFDAESTGTINDWDNGGMITPLVDSTQAHTGTNSAKITIAQGCTNGNDNGFRQFVRVMGGETRTVSTWAKVSGLTAGRVAPPDRVDIEVAFYDKYGWPLNGPTNAFVSLPIFFDTDGWTQLATSTFVAPTNNCWLEFKTMLIVNACPTNATKAKIEAWFDDVTCE